MRQDWSKKSRQELLVAVAEWETKLVQCNLALGAMRRKVGQGKGYTDPPVYEDTLAARSLAADTVRAIQAHLARLKHEESRNFEACFLLAADEILDDGTYNKVFDRAEDLARAG